MSNPVSKIGRWEGLREVSAMAGPIVLGALSFLAMQFIDVVFVSRLGPDALAAVGSAGIWSYTVGTLALGVVGCVGTFVAQCLGRGEREKCAAYAWQGIYVSIAAGSLALILWPATDSLFGVMGHSTEVTRLEVLYFRIRLLGFVFMAWQGALAAFFQAIGRPAIPMYVALVANLTNAVLDYVLIFGAFGFPRLEMAGAAIATVASLAIQAALDIASHIVSVRRLGEPETNRELFDLLRKNGLLENDLAESLYSMAGFRNVLVHGYTGVDLAIIKDILDNHLGDLLNFVNEIRKIL